MKYANVKVVRMGVAALLLGALSMPVAFADESARPELEAPQKEGLSLNELNKVVRNLEIIRQDRKLVFAGLMPQECANGARMVYNGARAGKHTISIFMPACEKDVPKGKMIAVSQVFPELMLMDASGTLHLRHLAAVDEASPNRVQDELLKDYKGQEIRIISAEELAEREREKSIQDLTKDIARLCAKGDFAGIGAEIERAKDLLGDVSSILEKTLAAQKEKYRADLLAAKNAADAKAALERYLEAAEENGWELDALNKDYTEKRFDLAARSIEDLKVDKELTASAIDAELVKWQRELRGMDRDLYKKNIPQFGVLYGDLAVHEAKKRNYVAAAGYYEKAKEFSSSDKALKFDAQLAKAYAEAFKACVKKNPEKMADCEKKYVAKSREAADNIKEALEAKAQNSDEDSEEYMAYMEQYGATFGQGPSAYYMGYGKSNPYAPGALEQYKYQALQDYQQNMWMKMQQGQGRGPAGGRGPLF